MAKATVKIWNAHADLRYQDIFKNAEEALQQNETSTEQSRLTEIRTRYANAYYPRTANSDAELIRMYKSGIGVAELAVHFRRQPTAVRSRLEKLRSGAAPEAIGPALC